MNNVQEYKISPAVEEGDVIGFSYDHVELNIFCNGKNLDTPVLGIKGTVFPVFYGRGSCKNDIYRGIRGNIYLPI